MEIDKLEMLSDYVNTNDIKSKSNRKGSGNWNFTNDKNYPPGIFEATSFDLKGSFIVHFCGICKSH